MAKHYRNVLLLLLSIGIIAMIGAIYYINQTKSKDPENQAVNPSQSVVQPTQTATNTTENTDSKTDLTPVIPITPAIKAKAMFSGKIQLIKQDLGIIINYGADGKPILDNSSKQDIVGAQGVYYQAGKFLDGKYKDQTRVLVIKEQDSGGGTPYVDSFATPDFKTYTLLRYNSSLSKQDKSLNTVDKLDLGSILDKRKVVNVDYIDSELPDTIKLDSQFSLLSQQDTYDLAGDLTDHSELKPLTLKDFPYPIFTQKYETHKDPKDLQASDKIFDGYSSVEIPDSTGLMYRYTIVWNKTVNDSYDSANSAFDGTNFDGTKITLNPNEKSYSKYDVAFPATCTAKVGDLNTVTGIGDSDLVAIGKIDNTIIYKLADTNNPLYTEQYGDKVDHLHYVNSDKDLFPELNLGVKKPTRAEYVAKNPLLFFKDPFGRMIVVGEDYYSNTMGGCDY